MSSDIAIVVGEVSKRYLLYRRPEDRLRQFILPRLQRAIGLTPRSYFSEFCAVNRVSFHVRRGETVGIVGRNGSGKSTLLQIICGTLQPSSGSVEVRGRVAALLELGAGFNPEFTGRENVYLNGAILGLSRSEIEQRFASIAAFADIGTFIDQPVKLYSSGMVVRLAFAVAVCIEPDILVVDEALAVGDEAFQRKCFARIEQIQDGGGTILFVSHSAQTIVQLCSKAILIDAGEILLESSPSHVVSQYQRLVNLSGENAQSVRARIRDLQQSDAPEANPSLSAQGGDEVQDESEACTDAELDFDPHLRSESVLCYEAAGAVIDDVAIVDGTGAPVNQLATGKRYTLQYKVHFFAAAERVVFGGLIKTVNGFDIGGFNTSLLRSAQLPKARPGQVAVVRFGFTCRLNPGTYLINVGALAHQGGETAFLHRILDAVIFRVKPNSPGTDFGYVSFDSEVAVDFLSSSGGRQDGGASAAVPSL